MPFDLKPADWCHICIYIYILYIYTCSDCVPPPKTARKPSPDCPDQSKYDTGHSINLHVSFTFCK